MDSTCAHRSRGGLRRVVAIVLLIVGATVSGPSHSVSVAAAAPNPAAAVAGLPKNGPGTPPLTWHGGWVQDDPQVYLVFWGPKWASDPEHQRVIATMEQAFQNLAGSQYNNVLRQYIDADQVGKVAGKEYNRVRHMGTWVDTDTPINGLFIGVEGLMGGEIKDEAAKASAHWGLPANRNVQILVFPEQGSTYRKVALPNPIPPNVPVLVDLMDACGMHSYHAGLSLPYGWVRYPDGSMCNSATPSGQTPDRAKNMAWTAVHEYAEIVTDPEIYFSHNPLNPGIKGKGWNTIESGMSMCVTPSDAMRCGGNANSKHAWMIAELIESCPHPAHNVETEPS